MMTTDSPIATQLNQQKERWEADPETIAMVEAEQEAHAKGMSYREYMQYQKDQRLIEEYGSVEAGIQAQRERARKKRVSDEVLFQENPLGFLKERMRTSYSGLGERLGITGTTVKKWIEKPERILLGIYRKAEKLKVELEKVQEHQHGSLV